VIGDGVEIGGDSILHAGVKVYDGCVVGARAILHAGAVIGADGLGFARDGEKRWVKIPQIGRVVLGDDVEVGANTTIDRGALGDTVIGHGVKLDNLIHIAHNCHVGDDTIMAAMAGIAGSARIGARMNTKGDAHVFVPIQVKRDR